jgi:hypothetical protein
MATAMTTAMAQPSITPVFQLADFDAIKWDGFEMELPEHVIRLVSSIADQVGAPSYVKTPIFPKRDRDRERAADEKKSRSSTVSEITEDDWESIRRFQATELKKREGIDAHLDSIRSDLNKITDKTFDEVFAALCARIDELKDEPDASHLHTVGAAIFNTASSNHFFSSVYARLFHRLLQKYDEVFKGVFETNFEQFMALFRTIERADSKKDYARFCEVNKTNDKRRAMSLFIILKDAHAHLKTAHEEEWAGVVFEVDYNSKLKPKNAKYPSVTNKTIFKHMDILDELKK